MSGKIKVVPFHPNHARALLPSVTRVEWQSDRVEDLLAMSGGYGFTALLGGTPLFCGGVTRIWQGYGEAWLLASPLAGAHYPVTLFKYAKRFLLLAEAWGNYHRVQASTLSPDGRRFLEHLGFSYETTLVGAGPNKEPMYIYVRLH